MWGAIEQINPAVGLAFEDPSEDEVTHLLDVGDFIRVQIVASTT
jgi:hypothetical protein